MTDTQLIECTDDTLLLHTGISDRDFAQAKLAQYMTDFGYLASPTEGEASHTFLFAQWRFTETELCEGRMTVKGPGFAGVPLLTLFTDTAGKSLSRRWDLLLNVFAALESAAKQKLSVAETGAAGILVSENGSVLFLPKIIVERAMLAHGEKTYAESCGAWINTALSFPDSLSFTVAVCLYRFLTGVLPFTESVTEKRSIDYSDANFIPLELCAEVRSELATAVNLALKKKQADGEQIPLQKLIDLAGPAPTKCGMSKRLEEKRRAFYEKKEKELTRKRFIRKQSTVIMAVAICVCLVGLVAGSIIRSSLSKPTTRGLSAEQTVMQFYTALNALDTERFDATRTRSAAKDYSNLLTSLYVTSKMRQAYEGSAGLLSPAHWLNFSDLKTQSVFGISRLQIDGKAVSLYEPVSLPDADHNGKMPQTGVRGQKATHTVTYYLIMTQAENEITVNANTDMLELTYQKDRWIISDVQSLSEEVPVNSQEFYAAENKTGEQFFWLPLANEVEAAGEELRKPLW